MLRRRVVADRQGTVASRCLSQIGAVDASLAGPLIDFGRIGARVAEREAQAQEAFADYRRVLLDAIGETEEALGRVVINERRAGSPNVASPLSESNASFNGVAMQRASPCDDL